MKLSKIFLVLGFIIIINTTLMCSNDDAPVVFPNPISNSVQVINTVSTGTWRIVFYEDSGVNETNQFSGFNFTFGGSNVLTATNGTATYTGSWSVTSSSDSSNDLDFNIAFTTPANFNDELTDDWDILSRSNTKLELIDISGGGGGTDYLTFEKN